MKDLKILILCFLLTLSLYSCKENTTDPIVNDPQPVVLYQFDSLSVSSSDSGRIDTTAKVQYLITDTTIHNINFQFTAQSNATLPGDVIFYELNVGKVGQVSLYAIKENSYSNLDTTYNLTQNIAASMFRGMTASFSVGIFSKSDYSFRYIRMKNMKITKMN